MKKFFSLMMIALPMLAMVSCSDDKDLPDVDMNFQVENATRVDGKLYVVRGDTIQFTSITVTNKEAGKAAMITSANFYWDYYYLGSAIEEPFAFDINVGENTPVGKHILEVECPLFAVDKEPATAVIAFDVIVVQSADDIPDGGQASFYVSPKTTQSAK